MLKRPAYFLLSEIALVAGLAIFEPERLTDNAWWILAACVTALLALTLYDHRRSKKTDWSKERFATEDVDLAAFARRGERILANRTFYKCVLKGPVRAILGDENRFQMISYSEPVFVSGERGSPAEAQLIFDKVIFDQCHFEDVQILVEPGFYKQVEQQGFETIPTADWRRRLRVGLFP